MWLKEIVRTFEFTQEIDCYFLGEKGFRVVCDARVWGLL